MRIQVFAVLKDHFEKDFQLSETLSDAGSLREYLKLKKPSAANILNICRFAVNDEFIDNDFQLHENDIICIIPPASGG